VRLQGLGDELVLALAGDAARPDGDLEAFALKGGRLGGGAAVADVERAPFEALTNTVPTSPRR
jgi:hypothetical protein